MTEMNSWAGALGFLREVEDTQRNRFDPLARNLVNALFVLWRSGCMHDIDNDAMMPPCEALISAVNGYLSLYNEDVALQLVDDNFFLNKRIIHLDYSTFENVRYLRRIFHFLKIDELAFTAPLDLPACKRFVLCFLDTLHGGQPATDWQLPGIKLSVMDAANVLEQLVTDDPRSQVLNTYASGLLLLRQFINDLRKGRSPRHVRVKRLCMDLIDLNPRYHALLLALIHLEAYKGNLFCHMLNTAVMALVFGQRLGLIKQTLVDLGMAAFHHDLGWALVGRLGEEATGDVVLGIDGVELSGDAEDMDKQRMQVVQALLHAGGFNEVVVNRLIVAYECQVEPDRAPSHLYYSEINASFMTQVVRIASAYDDWTTPRKGRPALPPDLAMKRILDDGGQVFDPFIAKTFVNCIGLYPVGTFVELDTGEKAMVVNLPSNPVHYHRPQVKLCTDSMGKVLPHGELVDLDKKRPNGQYLRTIERSVDAREYGLSIAHFFFGA